jgi:hypothetical protein
MRIKSRSSPSALKVSGLPGACGGHCEALLTINTSSTSASTTRNGRSGFSKIAKATSMQAQIAADEVVGGHIVIDMQSSDHAGSKTVFRVGQAAIAEMSIVENNDLSFIGKRGLERSAWSIRIAGGVDVALILALAYCRALVLHAWRR